ncbi:MAG: hypothetical protein NTU87_02180 [Verrucomicrobia bacterium]|nr:hypothetical protein [Verrucomicrobiota bacterium]
MKVSRLLWGGLWLLFSPFDQARAIVFFSQGNDVNLTNPGNGLPWENVVQMRSSTGPIGTGVYLGNRYVLTAGHVGPLTSVKVGFVDYLLDSSPAVAIGRADMQLVRLASDPGLGGVRLNSNPSADGGAAHLVGYGVGRADSSALSSSPVTWGDSSTAIKRWGTNFVDGAIDAALVGGYTSDLLRTQFNSNAGANEAALTIYDSGSALFRQIGSDWYLVGLGAYVQNSGFSLASTQFNSKDSDDSYFIRISSYAGSSVMIGGVGVPEPSSQSLLFVGAAFLSACLLARRSVGRRS